MGNKLLLIIPAYNEAENIERVVDNLTENYQMETELSDTSYNVSGALNGKPLTFAFMLKAAYKGQSAPLMSRLSMKTFSVQHYYYADPVNFRITDETDSGETAKSKTGGKQ